MGPRTAESVCLSHRVCAATCEKSCGNSETPKEGMHNTVVRIPQSILTIQVASAPYEKRNDNSARFIKVQNDVWMLFGVVGTLRRQASVRTRVTDGSARKRRTNSSDSALGRPCSQTEAPHPPAHGLSAWSRPAASPGFLGLLGLRSLDAGAIEARGWRGVRASNHGIE